MSRVFAARCYA